MKYIYFIYNFLRIAPLLLKSKVIFTHLKGKKCFFLYFFIVLRKKLRKMRAAQKRLSLRKIARLNSLRDECSSFFCGHQSQDLTCRSPKLPLYAEKL